MWYFERDGPFGFKYVPHCIQLTNIKYSVNWDRCYWSKNLHRPWLLSIPAATVAYLSMLEAFLNKLLSYLRSNRFHWSLGWLCNNSPSDISVALAQRYTLGIHKSTQKCSEPVRGTLAMITSGLIPAPFCKRLLLLPLSFRLYCTWPCIQFLGGYFKNTGNTVVSVKLEKLKCISNIPTAL